MHRDGAEEQVAALAVGCGACPALLCEVRRCSCSIAPCARAAGPGHPGHGRWWQACGSGVWVSGAT